MKKIYLISFVLISLSAFAQQGPIIEGTYLPVRGTAVKNIWDISPNTISIPAPGPNMVWDYSAEFLNPTDTFKIETFHPNTTPYFQYFPTATHASFLRTPCGLPSLICPIFLEELNQEQMGKVSLYKSLLP